MAKVNVTVSTIEIDIDMDESINGRAEMQNNGKIPKCTKKGNRYLSVVYEHFMWSLIIATLLYLVFGMFVFSVIESDNAERLKAAMKTTNEFVLDYLGKIFLQTPFFNKEPHTKYLLLYQSFFFLCNNLKCF